MKIHLVVNKLKMTDMSELKGKVAIITGAASGIGLSTANLFAEHGAKLIISDVDKDNLNKLEEGLKKKGTEVFSLIADVSRSEDSRKLVDKALEKFGKLDIAVNNAGIAGVTKPVADYPIETWNKVVQINLSGVFYGMHYQIPAMEKTSKTASIVNVASILGQVGFPHASAYVAAKHGVVGLTKTAALEYSAKGIRVNSVGPAYIDTPLLDALDEEAYNGLVDLHPIGRLGKPEEVAELILWLAGEKSSFVTGSYHAIDGGYLAP